MAGQIGEYISAEEIKEWSDLSEIANWFGESSGFEDGKVYSIYNNSSASFRFVSSSETVDETTFGTYVCQGSIIYFRPNDGEKMYVKGSNFNLAISEIK